MDKLYVNQTGGLPFTTNILNTMQNAYNIFNALGNLAGNYTIISGCKETGDNVAEGVVHLNGELLFFKGGTKISKVRIVELEEAKRFEDGTNKVVIIKRYVEFGTASNDILWGDFKRPEPLLVLTKKVADLEHRLTKTVPIGLVAVWDRPKIDIPNGWVEHEELRGKKPLGHNPDDNSYSVLGENLGNKTHTLLKRNIPKFRLKWKKLTGVKIDSWNGRDNLVYSDTDYHTKNRANINQYPLGDIGEENPDAINHLDPSRIVRFIRFVGFN